MFKVITAPDHLYNIKLLREKKKKKKPLQNRIQPLAQYVIREREKTKNYQYTLKIRQEYAQNKKESVKCEFDKTDDCCIRGLEIVIQTEGEIPFSSNTPSSITQRSIIKENRKTRHFGFQYLSCENCFQKKKKKKN